MIQNQKNTIRDSALQGGLPHSYQDIIAFLDNNWATDGSLERIKALDTALGSPSKSVNAIFVAGTNGKSLTVSFATKLLHAEGLMVGCLREPHIVSYQERIAVNGASISQNAFTDLAQQVLTTASTHSITITSGELLTMIALLHFKQQNTDVAILEVGELNSQDPINICSPKVLAITRITDRSCALPAADSKSSEASEETATESKWRTMDELPSKPFVDAIMKLIHAESWVVSADQSKIHLQYMEDICKERGAHFAMPVRKLATLPYPFEQLHGRNAALAERLAQLYVEKFVAKDAAYMAQSLLTKPKGSRGRPPINKDAAPKRTLAQFWQEQTIESPGRFQVLPLEKPNVVLDNASNIDAIKNLLLGVRLLQYKQLVKGVALILAAHEDTFDHIELEKQLKYFFKRTSGTVIVCPVERAELAPTQRPSWNTTDIAEQLRDAKIKVRNVKNFADALELAKKSVDEQHGLIVVTGSQNIISQYHQLLSK